MNQLSLSMERRSPSRLRSQCFNIVFLLFCLQIEKNTEYFRKKGSAKVRMADTPETERRFHYVVMGVSMKLHQLIYMVS